MAKNPETVMHFLHKIQAKLNAKSQQEINAMVALKRHDLDDPSIPALEQWDIAYYERLLKETKFQLDLQQTKNYFPLPHVIKGMFTIYESLLGVKFRLVAAATWHKDVLYYEITDSTSQRILAAFYMDLFPRPGKYKHASAFSLLQGYRNALGAHIKPVAAIVANINPPTAHHPALLSHDEVQTLFHEFGHIMHQALTKSPFASFAGSEVKRDFIEAPSQMLENWVWHLEPLTLISAHYATGEPLPRPLLEKMLAVKKLNQGIYYLNQLFYASIDLSYHSLQADEALDTSALYHGTYAAITHLPRSPAASPEASFGHLMSGYDASYYGYLWSQVLAADMFTRFEEGGLLNPAIGKLYRKQILEPGGSRDPRDLVAGFLGRRASEEAFLRQLE